MTFRRRFVLVIGLSALLAGVVSAPLAAQSRVRRTAAPAAVATAARRAGESAAGLHAAAG